MSRQDKAQLISQQEPYDYMVFFEGEWQTPPVFYWVAEVKGRTPEEAISANLAEIIHDARSSYPEIFDGLDDEHIEEALCTARADYWMSRHKTAWQSMLSKD